MLPLSDDNPHHGTPIITYAIIGLCVAVFLYQITLPGDQMQAFVYYYGLVPAYITQHIHPYFESPPNAIFTVFSSMFMHAGFGHIIGNMLYLWIFADNVEVAMGKVRFVAFYLLTGIAAAATQIGMSPESAIPMIGASGAVSGVLGAYLLLYPEATVRLLFGFGFYWRVVHVPASLVLGGWFLLQLFGGLMQPSDVGGVAFAAHIGGFLAGLALVKFFISDNEHLMHDARNTPWASRTEISKKRPKVDDDRGNTNHRRKGPWG